MPPGWSRTRREAASDKAASLRVRLAEAEVEATTLQACVKRLDGEAAEPDKLLSALLAAR